MLRFFSGTLVLLVFAAECHSAPASGPVEVKKSPVALNILEQRLNPGGLVGQCKTNDSDRISSLSGNPNEMSRWRNGYVVQLSPEWNTEQAQLIEGALYELSSKICIPIRKFATGAPAYGDFVYIQKGGDRTGCYSTGVGRQGGRQVINLQENGCVTKGIIMHENIHAMGFNHEQTRPDRDNFITIYPDQIEDGNAQYQYKVYSGSLTFGVPYDTQSIMHYGSYDFSKYGNPTMRKKDGSIINSQRNALTDSDISKLRKMYNC
ncbi:zinc metalloproteinase nas-4 [Folsomia candida]|uniref:Metalloendopeptidase n=1 Tax=Folsomia candida TaxID=158441 RepID=A0A226DUP3_FOLCA|nr:zinc metalloproteinase nas-4 [Folsomia candida]OXA49215.1 Zinc metalloproteinase nas-7 [Folsomia candida]